MVSWCRRAALFSARVRSHRLRPSVTGGSRAADKVFDAMLRRVLRAPMSYFDTTPMGRVLNRFTYDQDIVDILLTQLMSVLMISISWYVAGVIVMVSEEVLKM